MSKIPTDLQYTKDHEWARVEDGVVTVGITDYAQSHLGDVVMVELPQVGASLQHGKAFGTVESPKSVSDLYAPISGTVAAVNNVLDANPEKVNADRYGDGWIVNDRPGRRGRARRPARRGRVAAYVQPRRLTPRGGRWPSQPGNTPMRYIPHTEADVRDMLEAIGVALGSTRSSRRSPLRCSSAARSMSRRRWPSRICASCCEASRDQNVAMW